MNDIHQQNIQRHTTSNQERTLAWSALLAFAVTAVFLSPIHNMDIWWHLDSGRWMLDHHQYLGKEVRSFSLNGVEWHNFSWLFQVTLALLEKWGGMWGLLIFKAGLLWLMLTLLFLSMGRRGAPLGWLLVFVLFSWLIIPHVHLRPHLVEGVFLAIVIYWLQQEPKRRDIWRYALLILVWANVHASVVIGVTALSLHYMIGPHYTWRSASELARRLPVVLMLAMLVFATPNGFHLFDVLIGHANGEYMHTYIREWRTPENLPVIIWPVIAALLGATFLKMRIIRPAELFLIAFFLFYSLVSKRFLFELGLVLMRPSGVLAGLVLSRAGQQFPRLAGNNGWILGGLVLIGATIIYKLPLPLNILYAKDYPVAQRFYPHVAMSVLQPVLEGEQELRVWNAYGWGGYAGWRGNGHLKVYIDGRTPTVFTEQMLVKTNLSYSRPNFLRNMARVWKVGAILLHRSRFPPFLANDPAWRIAAYDKRSVLYLRSDLAQRYGIEPIGFDPFRPIRRVAIDTLPDYIRQLREMLAHDENNALAWLHLGEYLGQAWMIHPDEKGASRILAAMTRSIEEEPDQLQARVRMAMWLVYLGRPSSEIVQPLLPEIWKTPAALRSMYAIPLAKLFLKSGHPQEALQVLSYKSTRIQQKLDNNFLVWLMRLDAYIRLGDNAAAARINDIASVMSLDAMPFLIARYRALLARNPVLSGTRGM